MLRTKFLSTIAAVSVCEASLTRRTSASTDMMDNRTGRRNVGVLLGDRSVLLDWAGAAEVFYSSGFNESSRQDEFKVMTISKANAPVRVQVLGHLKPDFSVQNAPDMSVIILPGSMQNDLPHDAPTVSWIKRQIASGTILLTVCTGACVAARMGLLRGLTITTSHDAMPMLKKLVPSAKVVQGRRYIDSGSIVTSAGTTAGIDAALHLVERLIGKQRAADEREYLEYEWTGHK